MTNRAKNVPNGRVDMDKVIQIIGIPIVVIAIIRFGIWAHKPKTVYSLQINNNYSFQVSVFMHNDYDFSSQPSKLGIVPAHANVTFQPVLVQYTGHDFVFRDQQEHTVFRCSITGKNVDQAVVNNVYSITIGPQPTVAEHVEPSRPSRATHGLNVKARP